MIDFIQTGCGNEKAIILYPISPEWDKGVFCKSLTEELVTADYSVTVLDTLSLAKSCSLSEDTRLLSKFIARHVGTPDLACGFAFGGTLIQMMADSHLADCARILTISSPSFADGPLKKEINTIISLLKKNYVDSALEILHETIKAKPVDIHHLSKEKKHQIAQRLLNGFEKILQCDARNELDRYKGHRLALIGEFSTLATKENVYTPEGAPFGFHKKVLVPQANMRVLTDNPEFSFCVIKRWLEEQQ